MSVSGRCNFPKMPSKWRRLRKRWDEIFSRAKADIKDVQCRFSDTKEGCHAFGLPGVLGCRYKHDILVEQENKEKNEKKKPGSDPEKEKSGSGNNEANPDGGEKKEGETGKRPWQKKKKKGLKKKNKF